MNARNTVLAFCSVFSFLLLIGCAATTKIPTLTEDPECVTSVEGFYHCKDAWKGPKPAIVLTEDGFLKVMKGEIVSRDDKGLTFDPEKKSSAQQSTQTYYELSQLETVIDEKGEVVYGTIPKRYSYAWFLELYLEPAYGSAYSSSSKPHRLRLTPNERFGFCLPSGTYRVSEIRFIDGANNIDVGVNYPILRIKVDGGMANYVGDLFLNIEKYEAPPSIRVRYGASIPYRILSRPTSEAAAGFLGGALGAAMVGASNAEKGVIGKRELLVGIDDAFTAKCKSALKVNIVEVGK